MENNDKEIMREKMRKAAGKSLIAVELRFNDGSKQFLDDPKECKRWETAIHNQATICMAHGQRFPKLNWKNTRT